MENYFNVLQNLEIKRAKTLAKFYTKISTKKLRKKKAVFTCLKLMIN